MRKPKFWNIIGWLCFISWMLKITSSVLSGIAKGMGGTSSAISAQNISDPTILLIATILAFAYSDYLKSKQEINEST